MHDYISNSNAFFTLCMTFFLNNKTNFTSSHRLMSFILR